MPSTKVHAIMDTAQCIEFSFIITLKKIKLTEIRGLRLPDELQEGRNQSWTVEEFSGTLCVVSFGNGMFFPTNKKITPHRHPRTPLTQLRHKRQRIMVCNFCKSIGNTCLP
ncbi:hypothetical protein CSKR_103997 [Clonorchis sinensis]|uniref:Uncharacterized protein n=1 Tax=Clonorchis sinensis TaxID=79923 RepID=A0A3R7FP35_CLOSI|nr:hypothetical protein CSKR_103997 [Clonorchis sinensis]